MGAYAMGAQRSIGLNQDTFQYISLLEGLKSLLQNEDIFNEVISMNLHFIKVIIGFKISPTF